MPIAAPWIDEAFRIQMDTGNISAPAGLPEDNCACYVVIKVCTEHF